MTPELVLALYRALAMAVGTGVLATMAFMGLRWSIETFTSWVRYKRAERAYCCNACLAKQGRRPRGPLMRSARRRREQEAERAVRREEERRINGTASDFDPLARWAFDRPINFPEDHQSGQAAPNNRPYTRESGPQ